MKPEQKSKTLLSITRAKAKMHEYKVPTLYHIRMANEPSRLMSLAIGMLGDYASEIAEVPYNERIDGKSETLKFSAQFFDSYYQAQLKADIDKYLMLLGAASYYLCDLPGSSRVLTSYLGGECPDLDADGLEHLTFWLLQGHNNIAQHKSTQYQSKITSLATLLSQYRLTGENQIGLFNSTKALRKSVYESGSARELLFVDIVCALVRVMYENSSWRCLPMYSGLSAEAWAPTIRKPKFIQELWPAQRLLGKQGIYSGKSAVIQMPTSAGKTRATEIIIRSAFLSKRTDLAVVVAPFKALCHEIKETLSFAFAGESISVDEFSEVIQDDIDIFFDEIDLRTTEAKQQVYVVTPEKLVYVLRQAPQFADGIGLIIYDEGHQFDSGSRGVTFELLLTTLKSIVSRAQTILISAVLSNASAINEWLHPEGAEVISGTGLDPNYKSIAFSSWTTNLGQLHFTNENNPENIDFFVPRIIESYNLGGKSFFPKRNEPNSVSLFLGLKLVPNGSIAIFCGTKSTAGVLCKMAVDVFKKVAASADDIPLVSPGSYSNQQEVDRLTFLHAENLGTKAYITSAARLGIYNHHNNIPSGLRLAVEFSIRKDLTKFVICTSTLSQGVNLPIRYLIVSGLRQGMENMKIRDFHNLIGRAGRAGIYTEGSIIFGNPDVFDGRNNFTNRWRYRQAISLLNPESSEPCTSYLLSILESIHDDRNETSIRSFNVMAFAKAYVDGNIHIPEIASEIVSKFGERGYSYSSVYEQLRNKLTVLGSIESYLMSYGDETNKKAPEGISELTSQTLAYHLAKEDEQPKLTALFTLLNDNIIERVPTYPRRRVFGKTLYGLNKSIEIESWVIEHKDALSSVVTPVGLLSVIWPMIEANISSKIFTNLTNKQNLQSFTMAWIEGIPFYELLNILQTNKVEYIWGSSTRVLTIEQVVDLCQNALSFEGSLAIGAVCSILTYITSDQNPAIKNIKIFQKRLQYGLKNQSAVTFYELGFSDRVVAQEMAAIQSDIMNKIEAIEKLKVDTASYQQVIAKYPAYFAHILEESLE